MRVFHHSLILLSVSSAAAAAAAAPLPFAGLNTDYSYVELANMALAARVVIAAEIADAIPLKGAAAVGGQQEYRHPLQLQALAGRPVRQIDEIGHARRYYVQADVRTLISGSAVPARVTYLVDLPDGPAGKRLKLKGVPVLLLAVAGSAPGELRLVAPRAQIPRTPDNEQRVRGILTAAVAPDAPPAITGIIRAFHVAGSLPGEGETQIFLRTADRRPISLSILRRPNEQPRWAVALSELVDDSAAPPSPNSLLWYRLACGLPQALPESALGSLAAEDAAIAKADYQLVLKGLGTCKA
jgi:hypothetical protein